MTSGYDRTPTGLTDCEGRGKNTQYRREGNHRRVPYVSFWNKINHFSGNQRSCSSEKLDWCFLCSTADGKLLRKHFWGFAFSLDCAFGHAPRATLSPLLPLGQNFALGKKPQVEIITVFSSLVAETFVRLDSCPHFPISLTVEGRFWCVFDVPFPFYGRITGLRIS